MCLQTELSSELYKAKDLVFNLLNRTLGNSNLNIFWQYITVSISVVLYSFIKNQFITKSNDRMSEAFTGQASRPYNKIDALLLRASCNITCSDAVLPNSSKIALAAR